MRHIKAEASYDACLLAFQGVGYREIAKHLGGSPTTLVSWAKRSEWKSLEKELHEKKRQQVLDAILAKETSKK